MAMRRTNIEIDMEKVNLIKKQHGCKTTKEAVNFALDYVAVVPMTLREALAMRGSDPTFDAPPDQPPRSL